MVCCLYVRFLLTARYQLLCQITVSTHPGCLSHDQRTPKHTKMLKRDYQKIIKIKSVGLELRVLKQEDLLNFATVYSSEE